MANLINKKACKEAMLDVAKNRHHKFERVGSDVYDYLNNVLLDTIRRIVSSHPSIGKTIMMESKTRKKSNEDDYD